MLSRLFGAVVVAVSTATIAFAQPSLPGPEAEPSTIYPSDGLFEEQTAQAVQGGSASPYYRFWLTGEYFLGFYTHDRIPTLATTGPAISGGLVGTPGTQVILGGTQDFGGISGGRFSGGMWLDPCRAYGLEWAVSYLPRQTKKLSSNGGGAEVLARPFFDTALATENSRLIAANGVFAGSLNSDYQSFFWNADLGSIVRVLETETFSLEQTFHFRYFGIENSLRVTDRTTSLGGGTIFFNGAPVFASGAGVEVTDFYSAINRWYGGAVGLRLNYNPGRFGLTAAFRMGVGGNLQAVNSVGSTTLTGTGSNTTVQPGFTTAAQLLRKSTTVKLSYAPEISIRGSYHLTERIAITAGYQFLYLSNVARVGDQIVRNLNPAAVPSSNNFVPGTAVPNTFTIRQSDFYLHGLTVGLMLNF